MKHRGILLGLALLLAGCRGAPEAPRDPPITLRFAAQIGGEPFACAKSYGVDGARVEPLDLRLFVHDLRLVRADGAIVPVALDADGAFQTARVALLDFEDGTGTCKNGSAETRAEIHGRAPAGEYSGLRFRIGVPFEDNHGNPDLAPAPLNLTAMEWSWTAGHTFLRFDVRADGRPFVVHLGSTGCKGSTTNVTGCDRPNRAEVVIDGFSPARDAVVIDLASIVAAALTARKDGAPGDGCMGGADDADCTPVFAALGLDAASGQPARPARGFGVKR